MSDFRLRIEADDLPLDTGDIFTEAGMPDATAEERKEAEQEYRQKVYEDGGPWGFIVEKACPSCGQWEEIDSCWGFDFYEYCEEEGNSRMEFLREREED